MTHTWEISKRFDFSASHVLDGLPPGHQCGRLHGHNYSVVVTCGSNVLDATGFVVDYGEMGQFKKWIDAELDHRHLNDECPFNPTAENLAGRLYEVARGMGLPVVAVTVNETPKTSATFRPVRGGATLP